MRVVFFSNIPSPYFVEFLNLLSEKCDVEAYFERGSASDRDSSWNIVNNKFKYRILGGINIGKEAAFSINAVKVCKDKSGSLIILANPMTPTGILCNFYCRNHNIPFAMLSEGGMHGNGKGIKEKFKRFLVAGAEYYLSGMNIGNDYFAFYGGDNKNIHHYSFSSLHEYEKNSNPQNAEDVKRIRNKLDIQSNRVFLYVGRIMRQKGIDVLLKAYAGIDGDKSLYIVGGESTSEYQQIIEKNRIKKVFFVPYVNSCKLKEYYMCADCTILPTRGDTWGLVVNESLTYGTPVITTESCVAGCELIKNGINGYIVPTDDVGSLRDKMQKISNFDEPDIMEMRKNCIKSVEKYSYENMANEVYNGLIEFNNIVYRKRKK